MGHFLASLALFFMTFPLIISLVAATRFLPTMLWNFFWYYIFGAAAEYVFEGTNSFTITAMLILIYMLRILTSGSTAKNPFFFVKAFTATSQSRTNDRQKDWLPNRTGQASPNPRSDYPPEDEIIDIKAIQSEKKEQE